VPETIEAAEGRTGSEPPPERPYVIVSSDAHAGPGLDTDLRPYCPQQHLDAFDAYGQHYRQAMSAISNPMIDQCNQPTIDAYEDLLRCEGLHDPAAFLKDMDAEGIAAQVIFAGGGNPEPLPWTDFFNNGEATTDPVLRAAGGRIWNEWLADFVGTDPNRLVGVMQIPFWDIEASIAEMRWGKARGLNAVNFPAPRAQFASFNDPVYDPFWAASVELEMPLLCHVSGGDRPRYPGRGELLIFAAETQWFSRRGLAHLIFGGVFDRHPGLTVGFVEQRASWVPDQLRELDSLYLDHRRQYTDKPDRMPSEYWRDNCFVGCSFMAHFEAELRYEIGLDNLLWGSDYPHPEGTWQRTDLALRKTFAGIPEGEVRQILGDNGMRIYHLDPVVLTHVAERIGPSPADLDAPLTPAEIPAHRGLAFREFGPFA
jgi:predicted TIM-barrel fold metal-dependent hydrolase